jgi:hypothetical protein
VVKDAGLDAFQDDAGVGAGWFTYTGVEDALPP